MLSNFSFIISKTPYSFVIIACIPGFILHRLKHLVTFIVALNNDISYLVFPFLSALQMGGQIGIKAGNDAVLQHQAAVLENVQAAHGGRVDDITA